MGKEELSPDTFEKWRSAVVQRGYAEAVPGTLPAHYRLTTKGLSVIGAPAPASDVEHSSVSHANTPEGVAGRAEEA